MRFDMAYDLSGGEDMDFYFRAKSRGATTSWAPRAVVMEEMPQARLSVRQQFARAREKAIFSYRKKRVIDGVAVWWRLPLDVTYKAVSGLLLTLLAIPTNGRTLLAAVRAFGTAQGSILGVLGRRTSPYADVLGE